MKFSCFYFLTNTILICEVCAIFFDSEFFSRNGGSQKDINVINRFKRDASDTQENICKIERSSEQACRKYQEITRITSIFWNGTRAHKNEYPHMVALGFRTNNETFRFSCGGSLISPNYVLTAAHCLQNPQNSKLTIVRVGTVYAPSFLDKLTKSDIKVNKTIPHPKYDRKNKLHDIAVVKLSRSVYYAKNVLPLCLYTKTEDPQTQMEIVGWGETNYEGTISSILQKALLSPVEKCKCEKIYTKRLKLKIKSCHICAGDSRANICKGDSGGPLLIRDNGVFYQVGVIVFGEKCGTRTPGLYARVSSYLEWIEDIVWKKGN